MEQQSKTPLSFKLDSEKKKYISDTIENVSAEKKLDKGDTLYLIVKQYNEHSKQKSSEDYSQVRPFNCDFLRFIDETWLCLEPMGKSKKPIELGIDGVNVRQKCQACFNSRAVSESERKRIQLEKDNIKTLAKFYKEFMILQERGFDVSMTMCKGNLLEKNSIIVSRDGEILYCPLQEMKEVLINDVCKQVTNTANKKTGCQYLIAIEHHVNFDKTEVKEKLKDIFPQIENENLKDEKHEEET